MQDGNSSLAFYAILVVNQLDLTLYLFSCKQKYLSVVLSLTERISTSHYCFFSLWFSKVNGRGDGMNGGLPYRYLIAVELWGSVSSEPGPKTVREGRGRVNAALWVSELISVRNWIKLLGLYGPRMMNVTPLWCPSNGLMLKRNITSFGFDIWHSFHDRFWSLKVGCLIFCSFSDSISA